MKVTTQIFLDNPTKVLRSLEKMPSQQRVMWLYGLFIDAAPNPVLKGKGDKALGKIIGPYAEELITFLNSEYERMTASLTNTNMRKEVAMKHYIMMKKIENMVITPA